MLCLGKTCWNWNVLCGLSRKWSHRDEAFPCGGKHFWEFSKSAFTTNQRNIRTCFAGNGKFWKPEIEANEKGRLFLPRVDISTAKIRGKYQRRIRDFEPGSENVSRQCTYVMCVYTHARSPLATTRFRAKGFLGWWKRVFFFYFHFPFRQIILSTKKAKVLSISSRQVNVIFLFFYVFFFVHKLLFFFVR